MFSSAKKSTVIDWIRFFIAALIGVAIVTFAAGGASEPTDAPRYDGVYPPNEDDGVAMKDTTRVKIEKRMLRQPKNYRHYPLKHESPQPQEFRQRTPQWYDGLWDDQPIQFMRKTIA